MAALLYFRQFLLLHVRRVLLAACLALLLILSPCLGGQVLLPACSNPSLEAIVGLARPAAAPPISSHSALEEHFHRIWELIADNTMYPERLATWNSWEHKFDGRLSGEDDTEKAIKEMIESLHDDYTYFKNLAQTKAREQELGERNVVTWRMEPDNIGYINIRTFASRHTSDETKAALQMLASADAYVLDLRGNKGGCVDEAHQICAMFLDKGKFTSMRGRLYNEPYYEELSIGQTRLRVITNGIASERRREANLTGRKPVMVLVNNNTRSASEMLAGSLRDNKRARILGSKTFGKGVVQNTWILDNGTSIKIAIANYYLPGGKCINGSGIIPDYMYVVPGQGDQQLSEAVRLLTEAKKH